MQYFDISYFPVDESLQRRLGYRRVYHIGNDVSVQPTLKQSTMPIIIFSSDSNIIGSAIRDHKVKGIIFKGQMLNKKIIEMAAVNKKTIIIPISELLSMNSSQRQSELSKIKKIVTAAYALRAKVAIATLAQDKAHLLSKAQMDELSTLIIKRTDKFTVFGGDPIDN